MSNKDNLTEAKRFIKYLIRWQCSTPVLAFVIWLLPCNVLIKTIVANLVGGILFFRIDKWIFRKETVND